MLKKRYKQAAAAICLDSGNTTDQAWKRSKTKIPNIKEQRIKDKLFCLDSFFLLSKKFFSRNWTGKETRLE